jgi:hypothetical protein
VLLSISGVWSELGYDESSNDFDIIVKKWTGLNWVELTSGNVFPKTTGGLATYYGGGVSNDVFDSTDPSLAIGPDDAPVVAWSSRAFQQDAEIYVRRWNGSAWEKLGADSASDPTEVPVPASATTRANRSSRRSWSPRPPTIPPRTGSSWAGWITTIG